MTTTYLINANQLRKEITKQQEQARQYAFTYPDRADYYRGRLDSLTTSLLIVSDMQEDYATVTKANR